MSNPNTFIAPTIGRVVWFHPDPRSAEAGFATHIDSIKIRGAAQPYAAIVAHVWSDSMVNLTVFDANGTAHSRTSVCLIQGDAPRPETAHCEWMPFQKGQAKAQVEAMYSALQAAGSTAPLPEQEAKKAAEGEAYLAFAHEKGILPFDFGVALEYLKHGRRVARAGWNGKGMWLCHVNWSQYQVSEVEHLVQDTPKQLPWIGMRTADNSFVPWLASQTDMLAEDWVLLP